MTPRDLLELRNLLQVADPIVRSAQRRRKAAACTAAATTLTCCPRQCRRCWCPEGQAVRFRGDDLIANRPGSPDQKGLNMQRDHASHADRPDE